jgi:FAD/FMN-containing dehydrogenase
MSPLEVVQEHFPTSQILVYGSKEFNEQNSTYLAAQQSEIHPAAIFQPTSAKEVANFVKVSKHENIAFAIRGGGQNPNPFCSNIEKPGITLDLALLNKVEVKEGSISVGAGARWGALYDALDGTGLGVSGNRSAKGGIGGLALQGKTH